MSLSLKGYVYKECHAGSIKVGACKVGGGKTLELYGGGFSRGVQVHIADLIVDLTGYREQGPITLNGPASESPALRPLVALGLPTIFIDWPDGGVPALGREDWEAIAQALKDFAAQHPRKTVRVLVACQGGHGRTGTALAILGTLLGLWSQQDPVAYLRANYCSWAVETEAQISYLLGLGINTKAQGSYSGAWNIGFGGVKERRGKEPHWPEW